MAERKHKDQKWTAEVTEHSDALDLEADIFESPTHLVLVPVNGRIKCRRSRATRHDECVRAASRLGAVSCRTDARKPSAQKKRDRGWGRRGMRYSASEIAEIIRLVGQSALPVKRTLEKLGTRAT